MLSGKTINKIIIKRAGEYMCGEELLVSKKCVDSVPFADYSAGKSPPKGAAKAGD